MSASAPNTTYPRLGYFLNYRYWESAGKLLDFQLAIKASNRHFNTLSMFYYEGLGSGPERVKTKKYFESRVATNLFYGLEREFRVLPYLLPKSNLGIRRYKFLTYPLRLAYYAVGLYLVDLAQEYLLDHKNSHKKTYFWYGGDLAFDLANGELLLAYKRVWYKHHYKSFRRAVRREIRENEPQKIVLHLDIQNFYDEIDIVKLLDLLSYFVKPSVQREKTYDAVTKSELVSFFHYMSQGQKGIPQADNDIVSSYIGNLFMIFADIFIEQVLLQESDNLADYSIIRYMDDVYISLTYPPGKTGADMESSIHTVASRVADCLYERLGLRLNQKTRVFWLASAVERAELERNLKRVSQNYVIVDEDSSEHPVNKVANILQQLRKLRSTRIDSSFADRTDLDEEVLKDVYDENVQAILRKPEYTRKLANIFDGFNFDLINAEPVPLIILLLYVPSAASTFESFLEAKRSLSSRDAHLVLTYLCQTQFQSRRLIRALRKNSLLGPIADIYLTPAIASRRPGYYALSSSQCLRIARIPNVVEQVRQRVLCEHRRDYTVALNHLLNEIHATCCALDPQNIPMERYKVQHVVSFLIAKGVPQDIQTQIRNLFDRRNKNIVSHPDPIAWVVSEKEYYPYKEIVGKSLAFLL